MESDVAAEPHTITDAIRLVTPRARLAEILGVEHSRLYDVLRRGRLPTWMLARAAGRHLIPLVGRERAASMILATLEADYPDAFAPATPDAA